MADGNDIVTGDEAESEPTIFAARLTPYRALGRKGFTIVMLLIGGMSFVTGAVFWARGAWPVAGFCGLDVLVMWLAFRANFRAARVHEDITLTAHELVLERSGPKGPTLRMSFNPRWVRLVEKSEPDEGVTRLCIVSSGQVTEIGGFLNPDDRTSFAAALRAALRAVRLGAIQPDQIGKPA